MASASTSLKTLKDRAASAIDSEEVQLRDISSGIWSHPELNYEEHFAHQCLTDYLEKCGFRVERHYVVDTGFRATFQTSAVKATEGEKVPHVAVLCEYDALPDIGHACGHNLIAEIGVGAAVGIKTTLETDASSLNCKLTVLGCPAEEGGGGKLKLLAAGAFEGVDAALMSHPSVADVVMPKLPGIQGLKVTFTGQASHACTAPWEGINALDAAVMAYQNIAVLRQQLKPSWRVSAVISDGGTESYIIPEKSEMKVSYRALSREEMEKLKVKVEACIDSAATATGCQVSKTATDDSYAAVLHNTVIGQLYENNCTEIGLVLSRDPNDLERLIFSTDMGNVSYTVPSTHPIYSIGTNAPNHTTVFADVAGSSEAQRPTLTQAKVLAWTALDLFTQPRILESARREFVKRLS